MFKKSELEDVRPNLALIGTSGSGKTYSALTIASGLGEKIALIDAENRASSLYSREFDFSVANIDAPFTSDKYIECLSYAMKQDFDVIIIDSLSPAWDGEGGVLEYQKELQLEHNSKNTLDTWKKAKEKHNKLKKMIFNSPIPILVTIRLKPRVIRLDKDNNKINDHIEIIEEKYLEHEFMTVFEMHREPARATVWRDRSNVFKDMMDKGGYFLPTKETGKKLKDWVHSTKKWKLGREELNEIKKSRELVSWDKSTLQSHVKSKYGLNVIELDQVQYNDLLDFFRSKYKDIAVETIEKMKKNIELEKIVIENEPEL